MKRQPDSLLQMWPLEMAVLFKTGIYCNIKNKPLGYLHEAPFCVRYSLQENKNKHNFAYLSPCVYQSLQGFSVI